MTLDHLKALAELLQRTPMTAAEKLWTVDILNKEAELITAQQLTKEDINGRDS